jgi:hypothetical protein
MSSEVSVLMTLKRPFVPVTYHDTIVWHDSMTGLEILLVQQGTNQTTFH